MSEDNLTPKQRKFVESYILTFNGTQSAIKAGYAESGARTQASRLLTNDNVKSAINKGIEEIVKQTDDKRAYLINFWKEVIEDPKISINQRLRASDMLAKHLAMYNNILEIKGSKDAPIKVVWDE